MAYTLTDLQTDIRGYTEVGSNVFTDSVVNRLIQNAENKIYREVDSDQDRHYATSNLIVGNRYVTIPADLRLIRYVQLTRFRWKSILFRAKRYKFYGRILCRSRNKFC